MEWIYFIESTNGVKIGRSKNPDKRILELQTANPNQLKLIKKIPTKWSSRVEKILHRTFNEYNLGGEWFMIDYTDKYIQECIKVDQTLSLLMEDNLYLKNGGRF